MLSVLEFQTVFGSILNGRCGLWETARQRTPGRLQRLEWDWTNMYFVNGHNTE